ncbi:MAG: hypothetical protein ACK50P_00805, partial [Planctomycetaceae bacterium]
LQWDRRQRHLLPEIITIHLESEPCPFGTNWQQRKSQRFGPPALQAPSTDGPSAPPGNSPVSM